VKSSLFPAPHSTQPHLTLSLGAGSHQYFCSQAFSYTYHVGAAIRFLCYKAMGKNFTYHLTIGEGHSLITTGPYSVIRQLSYTAAVIASPQQSNRRWRLPEGDSPACRASTRCTGSWIRGHGYWFRVVPCDESPVGGCNAEAALRC